MRSGAVRQFPDGPPLTTKESEFQVINEKDATPTASDPTIVDLPLLKDSDDQHRELAQGAVREARDQLRRYADETQTAHTLTSDVVLEAECAWYATGLVHESYSNREIREIAQAVIGQVATVLLMVGWTPPKRLTEDES